MPEIFTAPTGATGLPSLDPGVFPYDAWDLDKTDPAVPILALQAPWSLKTGLAPRLRSLPAAAETSHTRLKTDRYTDYLITTGSSSDFTFIPPALVDAKTFITLWKVDSGTKEVVFDPPGVETVIWPGGSGTTVRVGLQGQHVTLMPTSVGWLIVSGVVQPVAREPDVGGGFHNVLDPGTGDFASKTSWVDSTFGNGLTVDFSSVGPAGMYSVLVGFRIAAAGTRLYCRRDGDTNISDTPEASSEWSANILENATQPLRGFRQQILLSSAGKAQFAVSNVNADLFVHYPTGYWLGPV